MTAVTALPVASRPLRPLPFAASGKDSSFGGTAAQKSVGTNLGVRTTNKGSFFCRPLRAVQSCRCLLQLWES
jgi:hypothetical protein